MRKSVTALLLVVVMLFCCTYATGEKSFEELLEEYRKSQLIQEVFENGLRTYPDYSFEGEYAFVSDIAFPSDAIDRESGKPYCGNPYLLTGKCLDVKGYGIDFELDDGRLAIVAFDYYDSSKKAMVDLGNHPKKGERCNIYCTFSSIGLEIISENCLHFMAGVTEEVKQLCLERGKY